MVNEEPLPMAGESVSAGATGRPWNLGQLNSDYYLLIDLRDADAYETGHLAGAVNIVPEQLPEWMVRFPREAKIIVYADDESTSFAAYQMLKNAGFTRPYVLLGGLSEWTFQYGEAFIIQI